MADEAEFDFDGVIDLQEIFDGAKKELGRRFNTPELAKELPGTALMQIALLGAKKEAADAEAAANKSKNIDRGSAVDVIMESSASQARKMEMLEKERARLEAEYAKVAALLKDFSDVPQV